MSSLLANPVFKVRTYDIDGSCPIKVVAHGANTAARSQQPCGRRAVAAPAEPWTGEDLAPLAHDVVLATDAAPAPGAETDDSASGAGFADETRALAERAAENLLAQARLQAEEILAGANQNAVAMAEEACSKAAGRLEAQLRSEIAALREQAAREAGEVVAKAQAERQVMLASAQREIITLALDIARRVVARELQVSADVVLSIAAEALGHLPAGTESARILVNPADLALVRSERDLLLSMSGGLSSLETQPDPTIARGGCVVQSPAGDVDGRLVTRFEQLEQALLSNHGRTAAESAGASGGGPGAGGGAWG